MDQPLIENIAVPSTLRGAGKQVRSIRSKLVRRDALVAERDHRKEAIDAKYAARLTSLDADVFRAAQGVEYFAAERREKLTEDGKHKTVDLPHDSGKLQWALNPPSANLNGKSNEEILAAIKRLKGGSKKFIRVKEEIDLEALKDDPGAMARLGISIQQPERFVIHPHDARDKVDKILSTQEWSVITPPASRKKEEK